MSAHQDASLVTDTGLPARASDLDSGMMAKAGLILFIISSLAIFTILVLTAGNAIAAPQHNTGNTAQHHDRYTGISIHTLPPQPQISLPEITRVTTLPDFAAPVTAIPEPSTYLMPFAGFTVCMLASRRAASPESRQLSG